MSSPRLLMSNIAIHGFLLLISLSLISCQGYGGGGGGGYGSGGGGYGGGEEYEPPTKKTKFNIGFNLPAMSISLPKLELPQISIKASVKDKKPFTLKLPIIKFNAHASTEEDDGYG